MSDRADGDWELYSARLDGSELQRLTWHEGWDGYADVAPDGSSIVFDRADDTGGGIMLMELASGRQEWLVRGDGESFIGGARYAPDGRSVIYAREEGGSRDIHRLWLADRRSERVTDSPGNARDAVFSPDGRRIGYALGKPEGGSALEVLDLGSGEISRLLDDAGHMYGIAWSHDGTRLLYNSDADGDHEIFVVSSQGGAPRQLTDNDVTDHLPVADPTGNRIVFTSERNGIEEIFIMDLSTGRATRVALPEGQSGRP